jgi:hypothetical protein
VKRIFQNFEDKDYLILDRETEVFRRVLRKGTVLKIVGWREIFGSQYILVSKDSWESLLSYDSVKHLIEIS